MMALYCEEFHKYAQRYQNYSLTNNRFDRQHNNDTRNNMPDNFSEFDNDDNYFGEDELEETSIEPSPEQKDG